MLEVKNLSVSISNNKVLDDISFHMQRGELVGIVGPNGAGKSTLLKSILGLQNVSEGIFKLHGENVSNVLSKIAYVPQSNQYDWQFPISVEQLVGLSLINKWNFFRFSKFFNSQKVVDVLKQLEIYDLRHRHISELSGGQKQRVLLARVLVQDFDLLLLDEPFVGIDFKSEKIIVSLLKKLVSEGKSVMMVHHDLNSATNYFDKILLLNKKQVAFGSVKNVLKKELLNVAYNGKLFS